MENIIAKLKRIPFSVDDMMWITENKCNLVLYDDLANVDDINKIFSPHNMCILFYPTTNKNLGHWCLLINRGKSIEYFDSYGFKPDEIIKYSKVKYPVKHLTNLLVADGRKIDWNGTKLQKSMDDVSTCGRHVSMRAIFKAYPLKKYQNLFKGSKLDPDAWVTCFTAFKPSSDEIENYNL